MAPGEPLQFFERRQFAVLINQPLQIGQQGQGIWGIAVGRGFGSGFLLPGDSHLLQQGLERRLLIVLAQQGAQMLTGIGEQAARHKIHRAGGAFDIKNDGAQRFPIDHG